MKIDTLKKKLQAEFNFSETYDTLENDTYFEAGSILLIPHYREKQRPWMMKAYNEWLKGDRTVVLIAPRKTTCKYFKKYLTDIAEVRPIKEALNFNSHRIMIPMIIAIYKKRITGDPDFIVSFD
jgi:hypothetical protein